MCERVHCHVYVHGDVLLLMGFCMYSFVYICISFISFLQMYRYWLQSENDSYNGYEHNWIYIYTYNTRVWWIKFVFNIECERPLYMMQL